MSCLQALRLDYLVQKVRPILTKLMSAGTGPQRGLFNVPVDPVKLGIPDYFRRVLHPMDLVWRGGKEGERGPREPRILVYFIFCFLFIVRPLFKLLLGVCFYHTIPVSYTWYMICYRRCVLFCFVSLPVFFCLFVFVLVWF